MTLIVGGTYLLAGVPDAIRHLEAGQARGKFAIGVGVGHCWWSEFGTRGDTESVSHRDRFVDLQDAAEPGGGQG